MKALVTGGAGFIGSNLVRRLLELGHEIKVLDNLSTGFAKNLDGLGLELIEGDIRDEELVYSSAKGCELVFHLAALPSVARSMLDPVLTMDINVTGTTAVLNGARRAGAKRLVFSSSSSVYGESKERVKVETLSPLPISPYGASKLAGEQLCLVFNHSMGIETVALRYFNVFGPRQDEKSEYSAVLPRFISSIKSGQAPEIYGDGNQSRDFTPVSVAVSANIQAALRGIPGSVYNVACGKSTTVLELAENIARIMGHPEIKPRFSPKRPGDILHSLADISAARRQLDLDVPENLIKALEETWEYFKQRE